MNVNDLLNLLLPRWHGPCAPVGSAWLGLPEHWEQIHWREQGCFWHTGVLTLKRYLNKSCQSYAVKQGLTDIDVKVYDGVGADVDVDFDVFVEDWSNFWGLIFFKRLISWKLLLLESVVPLAKSHFCKGRDSWEQTIAGLRVHGQRKHLHDR